MLPPFVTIRRRMMVVVEVGSSRIQQVLLGYLIERRRLPWKHDHVDMHVSASFVQMWLVSLPTMLVQNWSILKKGKLDLWSYCFNPFLLYVNVKFAIKRCVLWVSTTLVFASLAFFIKKKKKVVLIGENKWWRKLFFFLLLFFLGHPKHKTHKRAFFFHFFVTQPWARDGSKRESTQVEKMLT